MGGWEVETEGFRSEEKAGSPTSNPTCLTSADIAQLKEILLRSQEFEAHQDDLRSQAQGTTATRKDLAAEGDRLRRRIGASLQWKHGFGSETLLKFGFRPRRQPLRTKKREAPAVTNVSPETA